MRYLLGAVAVAAGSLAIGLVLSANGITGWGVPLGIPTGLLIGWLIASWVTREDVK